MATATLLLYVLASFAVFVTPGPTTLLALANGTRSNWRIAAMGILGAALSDLILVGAVALGLGAILAASEVMFSAVKWLGVGYLLWLAVQLWRSTPEPSTGKSVPSDTSPRGAFFRSLGVALANPKGLLFFSAFLPQFIDVTQPQATQYLILAAVSAMLDALVMTAYAVGGSQAAKYLTATGMRRLNRSCAITMASLAGFLVFYRRAEA
jgi:homoserine/homoserine lactone efflux protein